MRPAQRPTRTPDRVAENHPVRTLSETASPCPNRLVGCRFDSSTASKEARSHENGQSGQGTDRVKSSHPVRLNSIYVRDLHTHGQGDRVILTKWVCGEVKMFVSHIILSTLSTLSICPAVDVLRQAVATVENHT